MTRKIFPHMSVHQPSGKGSSRSEPSVHRAGWVIADQNTIIQNGYVKIQNGYITETGKGRRVPNDHEVDYGEGVILPGLVNAHTHLELSALKDSVQTTAGFQAWVKELIEKRAELDLKTLKQGAVSGMRDLLSSGCAVVGEISTLGITQDLFSESVLSGVWFQEFLGNPRNPVLKCRKGNRQHLSVAGHAPHTTSPDILKKLKALSLREKLPFSIHLSESEDERLFFEQGRGQWADFLTERGIDFSGWDIRGKTPVAYADTLGLLDSQTLAVHVNYADEEDLRIISEKNVFVCLCLRSNARLHDRIPDVKGLMKKNIRLCLGTDSLASVETLSIFDEMAYAAEKFPSIPPGEILAMATENGAAALGFPGVLGSLLPGGVGVFQYIPLAAANEKQLLEHLVNAGFDGSPQMIMVTE
ncbi:MAG: amidohydrolase family protein [Desulfobacterales bacterium]